MHIELTDSRGGVTITLRAEISSAALQSVLGPSLDPQPLADTDGANVSEGFARFLAAGPALLAQARKAMRGNLLDMARETLAEQMADAALKREKAA